MISKRAIEQYLKRKLDSYDWMKEIDPLELDLLLGPNKLKLWRHQLVALTILEEVKRFMLHIDMGGGKTLLSLSLIQRRKERGEKPCAIVFVPYITSVETWVEECAKHTPGLKCLPLVSSTRENEETLCDSADLYVICYASAVALVSRIAPRKKWAYATRQIFSGFDMLICDEIHRCKNPTSLTYRMCRAISAKAEYVLGLTGTPFGRDLQDLWPQFNLIDFGETLGPTLELYREVFFNQQYNFWGGVDRTFKKKLLPELKHIIKNRSIAYSIDEFTDMKPRQFNEVKLKAPEVSHSYIQAAIEQLNEGVKKQHYRTVQSNYLVLRQLASGFMTLNGDDSTKVQIKFEENPKLEALVDLIEAMPPKCKMVCFHHFVYTNHMISEKLTEIKVTHARIWGGQRDKIGELKRFKTDPDCRVLVINSRSGSASLNLQNANYCVFFEQPDSPIDRQQAERRVWRPGQTRRVLYYDFLVMGTVDQRLLASNKAGEDMLKKLLREGI
jgi:SNF2 family DNA or RNA helicase